MCTCASAGIVVCMLNVHMHHGLYKLGSFVHLCFDCLVQQAEAGAMQAAAVLGIAQKEIIHCVNYTNSTERKFETDRLTYKILDMVLHNARNFCEADRPLRSMQSLISGDWENEDDVLEW